MTRIDKVRQMATRAGGWVRVGYPVAHTALVYNPDREELAEFRPDHLCEGASELNRLDGSLLENGAKAVAVDRYGRENTRGNYVRVYRNYKTSAMVHLDDVVDAGDVGSEVRAAAQVVWQWRHEAEKVAETLKGRITETDEWLEQYGIKSGSYGYRLDLSDDSEEAQELEEWISPSRGRMNVAMSAEDWARVLWMLGLATSEDIKANHMSPASRELRRYIGPEGEVRVPVYKAQWIVEDWEGMLARGAKVLRTGFLNTYGGE